MYATPFCTHEFTLAQLDSLEWVVCPCGYHFRSEALKSYNETAQAIEVLREELAEMVSDMRLASRERQGQAPVSNWSATGSTSTFTPKETPVAPRVQAQPKPAKPARPKREIPTISVTQWLIMAASVLVLIAASVFVSNAVAQNQFNAYGWYAIELGLGAAASLGAIKGRKISILLSNFLAVFSSSMLLSFIMSFGTQIGLGFNDFRSEPPYFWAINLILVALATMFAGRRFNNFGWRATSPVALAIGGLILSYGAIGAAIAGKPSAFGWQLISISATIIGVLVVLRYLRSAKLEVAADSKDKAYETDLHAREDKALQKFAFASSVGLAGIAAIYTITQLIFALATPFDFWATTALGAFWLAGSATIDFWGTPLSKSGKVPAYIKTITWNVAYVSLGLGLIAGAAGLPAVPASVLALCITLALLVAPRYAHFVKPSTRTLTVTSWATLAAALGWIVSTSDHYVVLLGAYVFGFSMVLTLGSVISGGSYPRGSALVTRNLSLLALAFGEFTNWINAFDLGFERVSLLVLFAAVANADVWLGSFIAKRTKTELLPGGKWINLATSAVGINLMLLATRANIVELVTIYLLVLIVEYANFRKPSKYWNTQTAVGYGTAALTLVLGGIAFSNLSLWFLALGGIAYAFGYLEKSPAKLFGGLAGIYVSSLAFLLSINFGSLVAFEGAFILPSVLVLANAWVLSRRTALSAVRISVTSTALLALVALTAPVFGAIWGVTDFAWAWTYLAAALLAIAVAEFSGKKVVAYARSLAFVSLGYGYLLLHLMGQVTTQDSRAWEVGFAAILFAYGIWTVLKSKRAAWSIAPYIASLMLMFPAGSLAAAQWNIRGNDLLALPEAVLVALTGWSLTRATSRFGRVLSMDMPLAVAAVPVILQSTLYPFEAPEGLWRRFAVGAVVLAYGTWRGLNAKNAGWLAASYVGSLVLSTSIGYWVSLALPGTAAVESYAFVIAVLFVLNGVFMGRVIKSANSWLTLDLPVLLTLATTLVHAFGFDPSSGDAVWRRLLVGVVFTAFATWRALSNKAQAWGIATYAGSAVLVSAVGVWLTDSLPSYSGPETYSVLYGVLFAMNSISLKKVFGARSAWLFTDLPLTIVVLPSFVYALMTNPTDNPAMARLIASALVIGAYSYWRAAGSKVVAWVVSGFIGTGIALVMSVSEVQLLSGFSFVGPEAYSLAGLLTAFIAIRALKRLDKLEGTLITWGLPLSIAIVPSALYSYNSLEGALPVDQIIRVILVIAVSMAATILGVRKGNLGATTAGTLGLALTAVPSLWNRVGDSAAAEIRGLLIAAVLFVVLSSFKRIDLVHGNSLLFVGLPMSIALAPAVVNAIAALGHSDTFTNIDWWRFAIVLISSLTLLVVGALREVGGMFFPGFAGVLVAALPYGFKQVDGASWLLWVVLLLVAATLIWVAMHIEKMRKLGRTPGTWIRELK